MRESFEIDRKGRRADFVHAAAPIQANLPVFLFLFPTTQGVEIKRFRWERWRFLSVTRRGLNINSMVSVCC